MKVTNYTINEIGIDQIADFLKKSHKKGEMIAASRNTLMGWAADAEFQLAEGNSASVEIKACDSVRGRTEAFTIGDEGLNAVIVEIDE